MLPLLIGQVLNPGNPGKVCAIIIPILHIKLRSKETESFASGHTAN